ncbi:MAG: hypothetical protein WCV69_02180 [Patescibacteria group bacterium]|jgi:hypothetical protein
MNNKKTRFKKIIRIDPKQLSWLKKNKDTQTMAGYLDKIINNHKKRILGIPEQTLNLNKKTIFLGYYNGKAVYKVGQKLKMLCNYTEWRDYAGSVEDLKMTNNDSAKSRKNQIT